MTGVNTKDLKVNTKDLPISELISRFNSMKLILISNKQGFLNNIHRELV